MATSRTSKVAAAAAKERAAKVEARKGTLSRDVFLRSQGPKVVEIHLPVWDCPVLMKRVDLLQLARTGRYSEPITAAVIGIIQHGGLSLTDRAGNVLYNALDAEHIMGTLDASAAVAMACIVVPPAEYLSGEIAAGDIDPRTCKPLFVAPGEDPDDDQVVLDWITPAEQEAEGYDEAAELAHGRMHPKDLAHIFAEAHRLGPGALGATFRKAANAVEALDNVADVQPAGAAVEAA